MPWRAPPGQEETLRGAFSEYGNVQHVKVIKDKGGECIGAVDHFTLSCCTPLNGSNPAPCGKKGDAEGSRDPIHALQRPPGLHSREPASDLCPYQGDCAPGSPKLA